MYRIRIRPVSAAVAILALLALGCQPAKPAIYDPSESVMVGTDPEGSRTFHLEVGGGTIAGVIRPGNLKVSDVAIRDWVQTAAKAISHYFGHYPIHHARVVIDPAPSGAIGDGVTNSQEIRVNVGADTTDADLNSDWVMTHEMYHLAFPVMDEQYDWLREGLASYLEPLARARIGNLSTEQVWRDLYEGLPRGQPQPGDKGLDDAHGNGRIYWGGSMFCLLADLQIRQKTQNRRSLDDAMRSILESGANRYSTWTMQHVIEAGDQATATTVLRDLYQQMGSRAVTVDLNALWESVGVKYQDKKVIFDDSAPLAAIRKSMTR